MLLFNKWDMTMKNKRPLFVTNPFVAANKTTLSEITIDDLLDTSGTPYHIKDINTVSKYRGALSDAANHYSKKVTDFLPIRVQFYSDTQKRVYRAELEQSRKLLITQFLLDKAEGRQEGLVNVSQILACEKKLRKLDWTPPEVHFEHVNSEGQPTLYLGLLLGMEVAKEVHELLDRIHKGGDVEETEGLLLSKDVRKKALIEDTEAEILAKKGAKTRSLRQKVNMVNDRRLFWVWAGSNGMMGALTDYLDTHFDPKHTDNKPWHDRTTRMKGNINALREPLGYFSFVIYYFRFAIDLFVLLKHTFSGKWMSKEEAQIDAWERFKTQWNARKFMILNDVVWATINLMTFKWFWFFKKDTGKGQAGFHAGILTTALLVFDIMIASWMFWEAQTKFNEKMQRYDVDLNILASSILSEALDKEENRQYQEDLEFLNNQAMQEALCLADLRTRLNQIHVRIEGIMGKKDPTPKEAELYLQYRRTIDDRDQDQFDWKYEKYQRITGLVYAISLTVAFMSVCGFHHAANVGLMFPLVGSLACYALTLTKVIVSGIIDIMKISESRERIDAQCKKLLNDFNGADTTDNTKKLLYLDMLQLMAKDDHQIAQRQYLQVKLMRNVLVDLLIPPITFVSFMFLPLAGALPIFIAAVAIAIVTHFMVKRLEPSASDYKVMENEQEEDINALGYDKFLALTTDEERINALKGPLPKVEQKTLLPKISLFGKGKTGTAPGAGSASEITLGDDGSHLKLD